MPILDNPFTCPNGHTFSANAKLRARCPQCGALAKRDFVPTRDTEIKPQPMPEPSKPKEPEAEPKVKKTPMLVRKGKQREVPKPKPVASKPKPKLKVPSKPSKASNGLVRTKRIKSAITPKATRPPKRTAIARHIKIPQRESMLDSVLRRYGPG